MRRRATEVRLVVSRRPRAHDRYRTNGRDVANAT